MVTGELKLIVKVLVPVTVTGGFGNTAGRVLDSENIWVVENAGMVQVPDTVRV